MDSLGNNSYLNARYLSHTTGRFITQDYDQQFNSHYVYGNGRIIKLSDRTGNMLGQGDVVGYSAQRTDAIGYSSQKAVNEYEPVETANQKWVSSVIDELVAITINEEKISKVSLTGDEKSTSAISKNNKVIIAQTPYNPPKPVIEPSTKESFSTINLKSDIDSDYSDDEYIEPFWKVKGYLGEKHFFEHINEIKPPRPDLMTDEGADQFSLMLDKCEKRCKNIIDNQNALHEIQDRINKRIKEWGPYLN